MIHDVVRTVIDRAGESLDMLPTEEEATVIGSNTVEAFVQVGHDFIDYLVNIGGLTPDQRVLEIGSGIGRIYIPLTRFLSKDGTFDGVEPIERFVTLSKQRVTTRFPNFRFHHVDFHNRFYNPAGNVLPESYRFPWKDESFDFVMLVSVFTHILKPVTENYIAEISRMLRPGGTLFATAFLLNQEVRTRMHKNEQGPQFVHPFDGTFIWQLDKPEGAVAYEEADFLRILRRNRLKSQRLERGTWAGPLAQSYGGYQDVIVARKKPQSLLTMPFR